MVTGKCAFKKRYFGFSMELMFFGSHLQTAHDKTPCSNERPALDKCRPGADKDLSQLQQQGRRISRMRKWSKRRRKMECRLLIGHQRL